MRWERKHETPPEGTERIIKKFAWQPTVVGKQWIWLESYQETQIVTRVMTETFGRAYEWKLVPDRRGLLEDRMTELE